MSATPEKSQKQDSAVWVWDSTWLPAIVVDRAGMGCVSVRLEHGVTFNVNTVNLVPRDPARRGGDMPVHRLRFRAQSRSACRTKVQ